MIDVLELELPCCPECYDWLRPVLMVLYPFDGVVWICVNGHRTIVQGWGDDDSIPDGYALDALSLIAHGIGDE